jgi:hypothetical protein
MNSGRGEIVGMIFARADSWGRTYSYVMGVLQFGGAAVFAYIGLSNGRARRLLYWSSKDLRASALFWGLTGLLSFTASSTVTVVLARELFLENRKPTGVQPLHVLLLTLGIGAVLASWQTLTNARRMRAAARAAPCKERLSVLNPLSKLRTAEHLSSPSVRFLVFVLTLFITVKFWLGDVGMWVSSRPAGSNVLAHMLGMTLLGLGLCGYVYTSRTPTSAASFATGIYLRVIGMAGCIIAASLWASCFLLLAFKQNFAPGWWWIYKGYSPAGMLLAGYVYHAGQDVLRFSRRHLTKIIRDPARLDGESFVLYLRPFRNDALQESPQRVAWRGLMPLYGLFVTGRSEEERIAAALKKRVGPLIAVGRPGEILPYVGASRLYLPLDDWQEPVRKLIARARLVVLTLGPGKGTMWELREALRTLPPERLILLVPMGQDEYEEFRLRMEADLKEHDVRVRARGRTRAHVPTLPRSTSGGNKASVVQGMIYFTPSWTAEYVNLNDFSFMSAAFFDLLPEDRTEHTMKGNIMPGIFFDWLPRALKAGLRPAIQQLAAYESDPDRLPRA